MPCSCGNTNCSCGIPCCCSEDLCKCQTCAITFPRLCKICNKPLISEIPTDEKKCSCFVGASTALILENQSNTQCRIDNIPMPTSYFLHGKLMVHVMIPVPGLKCQHFIPPQPICVPALTSIPKNSRNILPSFISDEDSENLLYPKENSSSLLTAELHKSLDKSNEQANNQPPNSICSNIEKNINIFCEEICSPPGFLQSTDKNQIVNTVQDTEWKTKEREDELSTPELNQISNESSKQSNHPSTSTCLNGEQNTKISCEKTRPSPGFSQSTEEKQRVNVEQITKLETEERSNIQESSFYLPSITINNIPYSVSIEDPIWRLSNPAFCFEGSSDSSLKIFNPFYASKKVTTTETMAIYEKDCCFPPSLHFEGKSVQYSTKVDKSVQTDSTVSFQMNEHPSNQMKIPESNEVVNGAYAVENECIILPSINSNTVTLPEKWEMTPNSMPGQNLFAISTEVSPSEVQTQPLCVAPTSVYRMNDYVPAYTANVPLPAYTLPNTSQILPRHSTIVNFSPIAFRRLFTSGNNTNLNKNDECLPTDHASLVTEMNQKNKKNGELNNSIPLYIDPCTTQKMEKLLKAALE